MCPSTRPEPISAPSSITSITDADCTPHSAINPRLSSKPNSAKSKPSERTQPKLCPSNPLSQTKGAVQIMLALILRRIALIEAGVGGPGAIGPESSPDVIRLQGFLARNAYPHQLLDPTRDPDAAKLVEQYATNPSDLPLAVCPKGTILKN